MTAFDDELFRQRRQRIDDGTARSGAGWSL
jgi:hypothetical protein